MRIFCVVVVACALGLAGCGSIQCDFVSAVKASDDVIMPEYIDYLEADDSLTDEERADIMKHVEKRRALIEREAALCE